MSETLPSFHGPPERDIVKVFQIASHRDARGDSRHLYRIALEALREVRCRGLSLHIRIGRDGHFSNPTRLNAFQERLDLQVVRADPVYRREDTLEYMIDPLEGP